jgi:hypothetical protein
MASKQSQDIGIFNGDLYTLHGDFAIAYSDQQHVSDTLAAFPGWWKQFPADGVGILQYLGSTGQEQTIERSVKIQLSGDGYKVSSAGINVSTSGQLTINPNAEKL